MQLLRGEFQDRVGRWRARTANSPPAGRPPLKIVLNSTGKPPKFHNSFVQAGHKIWHKFLANLRKKYLFLIRVESMTWRCEGQASTRPQSLASFFSAADCVDAIEPGKGSRSQQFAAIATCVPAATIVNSNCLCGRSILC